MIVLAVSAAQISAMTAVLAWLTALAALWFARTQVLQAKAVREEQNRPYVIIDFEFKGWWTHLVVKNIGSTPARDVAFSFDKELQVPDRSRRIGDFEIFSEPIPMIAPGRVIRVPFGAGPDFFRPEAKDIPLSYVVTLAYTDLSGEASFADPPLLLDLLPYKNTIVGSDHISDISSTLKDIRQTMKAWTSEGSVRIRATDQQKMDRRTNAAMYRYQARRTLRSAGVRGLLRWQAKRWQERLGV